MVNCPEKIASIKKWGGNEVETTVERNKVIFLTDKDSNTQDNLLQDESKKYKIKYINHGNLSDEKQDLHSVDLAILNVDNMADRQKLIDKLTSENVKVGILASNIEKEEALMLFRLNLDGYFHTQMDEVEFNRAVNHVLKGNKYIHSTFSNYILKDYARLTGKTIERPVRLLSNREWEILEQMVKGYSNKIIGENLLISERTVKNHISSIFRKINVDDRTSAVVKAIRNNWVVLD